VGYAEANKHFSKTPQASQTGSQLSSSGETQASSSIWGGLGGLMGNVLSSDNLKNFVDGPTIIEPQIPEASVKVCHTYSVFIKIIIKFMFLFLYLATNTYTE
jgi:hypothetical protein